MKLLEYTAITLLIISYALSTFVMTKQQMQIEKQLQHIEQLQNDSLKLHNFFEEQSRKNDFFYNEWVNFK